VSRYFVIVVAVAGLLVSSIPGLARNAEPSARAKKTAFLGVQTSPGQKDQEGALVADVVPKSPAARAGLRKGDLITRVDEQQITSPPDLIKAVRKAGVGTEIKVTARRGDKDMEFKAKLAEAPLDLFSELPPSPFPGVPGLGPRGPEIMLEMPDRIRKLQDRVDDLERRLRALEQKGKSDSEKK